MQLFLVENRLSGSPHFCSSHDNLRAIAEYPEPTMYTSIYRFIGIIGHYQQFIKGFAKITEPLHNYTRGDLHEKKKESLTLNKKTFNVLKKAVMTAPVLAYPDPNKEYLLETAASNLVLGQSCHKSSQMVGTILWHSIAEPLGP